MTSAGLPFDDMRAVIAAAPDGDEAAAAVVCAREAELTKPAGALGRLEEIAEWVARWSGQARPKVLRPRVAIFAGTHGVATGGVSAFPPEVTWQMVANFAAGGAAINQIAAAADASLQVFELALDAPTGDLRTEAAMSEKDCAQAFAYGFEAVSEDPDLLALGEMGIGNTTAAAALSRALFGGASADWVGRGTGVDDAGLARKIAAVDQAFATHGKALDDPLEALRRVGGRELAALAGAIVAARHQKIPVLLDGYVVTAAAAVLQRLRPDALDHCLAAHVSVEPGHRRLLAALGMRPLLDLDMRLGEGSGAALAIHLVKAACAAHGGMATFAEAGVAGRAAEG